MNPPIDAPMLPYRVLRATFNALDYQGVGYLTSSTLLRGLIGFFPDLTDEEVRVMIKNNTSGRNGNRITLEDLIDMFG